MTPQHQDSNTYSYSDYPTSPWTEAYQATPAHQPRQAEDAAPKHAFDSEALRPTRDALSDIYNRGY
jgi:hypothetical protein